MIATDLRCGCSLNPNELERSVWCRYHTGLLDGMLCTDDPDITYASAVDFVAADARQCHEQEIDR